MVLARFGRRACLVAVVLGLIPASVLAQGASTATIAGVVRDSSGSVLPGATVEAASPALIEKVRTAVTDERGQYRLAELRPGTYTVTFSLAGFATVKHEGLELRTNFTAIRSLIELPGLKVSSLASTVASVRSRVIALMRTSGVCPMVSRMLLQMQTIDDNSCFASRSARFA